MCATKFSAIFAGIVRELRAALSSVNSTDNGTSAGAGGKY